jgi:hypothetical protein
VTGSTERLRGKDASEGFIPPRPLDPKLDALEELVAALGGSSRAVVISEKNVDLRPGSPDNRIFLLQIGEGSLAAGGRGGGFGERRVTAVFCFGLKEGVGRILFRADEGKLGNFEVPYHVSRLPITLVDGSETMGYGLVDPELVLEWSTRSGIVSFA